MKKTLAIIFVTLFFQSTLGFANESGGQKVCSAIVPGEFRDSVEVPDTWTVNDCHHFASIIAATHVQLMCFFPNSESGELTAAGEKIEVSDKFSSSALKDSNVPSPNCGW